MKRSDLQFLGCPSCGSVPELVNLSATPSGVVFSGGIRCPQCGLDIGSADFGKLDFRDATKRSSSGSAPSQVPEFEHRRIPIDSGDVVHFGMNKNGLPWNAEVSPYALFAEGQSEWRVYFETFAFSVSLRHFNHPWSGMVDVYVNGKHAQTIDLYAEGDGEVTSTSIVAFNPGRSKLLIEVRPNKNKNPASASTQVFLTGFDVAEELDAPRLLGPSNRGNGYSRAYAVVAERLPPDARMLDVGCGDRRFGDPRFCGLDLFPFALADVYADCQNLPFKSETFDAVFSQAVLAHVPDPASAVKEMVRVLKPGGLLYIETAFMQPVSASPVHYFNISPDGLGKLVMRGGGEVCTTEWFGAVSYSIMRQLRALNIQPPLAAEDAHRLESILRKLDERVGYEDLKNIAGGVALWARRPGELAPIDELLSDGGRPSFKH